MLYRYYFRTISEKLESSTEKKKGHSVYAGQRTLSQDKKGPRWFGQKKVNVMQWPPQSPDLNPIESIWNDLSLAVRRRKDYPKSLNELRIAIHEEWRKIPCARITKLYESMQDRLREVKRMNGYATKY